MDEKMSLSRKKIDETDREIARLFEKRMEAVKEVAYYKQAHGLPVYDKKRETEIINKNSAYIRDKQVLPYYVSFFNAVLQCSKDYQNSILNGMRVAFCGVEGAFANIAAKKIFPTGQMISFDDFRTAYKAVENGECDCCVLPIENSTAGEVGAVLDLMYAGSLYINGVYSLPVVHHLLGTKNAEKETVRKVISHPQALMQCADYIEKYKLASENASNTAVAAQTVARLNDASVAAIASRETAELYGLKILDHDINASSANTTRFAVFSRAGNPATEKENHFILLFTLNNAVGALAKAINIISAHGFDMRVLRSRPVKGVSWQYYFYVEAVGDQFGEEGIRMQKELSVCCVELKVIGHYQHEIDLGKEE